MSRGGAVVGVLVVWARKEKTKKNVLNEEKRTDGVVFQHAQGPRLPGPREGVEEARHGHGDQAHGDHTGFRCGATAAAATAARGRVSIDGIVWNH